MDGEDTEMSFFKAMVIRRAFTAVGARLLRSVMIVPAGPWIVDCRSVKWGACAHKFSGNVLKDSEPSLWNLPFPAVDWGKWGFNVLQNECFLQLSCLEMSTFFRLSWVLPRTGGLYCVPGTHLNINDYMQCCWKVICDDKPSQRMESGCCASFVLWYRASLQTTFCL